MLQQYNHRMEWDLLSPQTREDCWERSSGFVWATFHRGWAPCSWSFLPSPWLAAVCFRPWRLRLSVDRTRHLSLSAAAPGTARFMQAADALTKYVSSPLPSLIASWNEIKIYWTLTIFYARHHARPRETEKEIWYKINLCLRKSTI